MIEARKMTIEDYDAVFELWKNTPGMGLNNIDDSREGIAKYLRRNPDTSFVAFENGELIGVILSGHDGRRGFIYHTAVRPASRRQGIGNLLVECAMMALEKEGISKVALVVFNGNDEGNAFWERQGFTVRKNLIYRDKLITELEYAIPNYSRPT